MLSIGPNTGFEPKLSVVIVSLAVLSCLLVCPAESLRNNWRSVELCDTVSPLGEELNSFKACESHCRRTYSERDKKSAQVNRHIAESIFKAADDESTRKGGGHTCCCRFNAKWPDFVSSKEYGLTNKLSSTLTLIECKPLIVTLGLCERTVKSYDTVCKYLKQTVPLTMLEVVDLVRAAAFLKYMYPKNLRIRAIIRRKDIRRIDEQVAKQIESLVYEHLLPTIRMGKKEHEGYSLDPKLLDHFFQIYRRSHSKAIKSSQVLIDAFEEYLLSATLVDLAYAHRRLQEINTQELRLPEHLLVGVFDQYDMSSEDFYFKLDGVDCKLLKETRLKLEHYHRGLRNLFGDLSFSWPYERLLEFSPIMQDLMRYRLVYKQLAKVNC